jgi:hypothetical protein
MTQQTCTALTAEGKPCPAPRQTDSPYCLWHDPERKIEAQLARSRGGIARKQTDKSEYPGDIETPQELLAILNAAMRDAFEMEGNIQRLHVITGLIRAASEVLALADINSKLEVLQGLLYATNKSPGKNN